MLCPGGGESVSECLIEQERASVPCAWIALLCYSQVANVSGNRKMMRV